MPVQIESVAIALYAVYAAAGLQQLVFSLIDADWKLDFYFISFVSSVNCLAIANVLHSVTMFGWWLSFLATFGCFVIILYFEELGLSTGLIFGDYHFTKEMGFSISPNLPALVPVLWCAVIYPSMLLAVGALGTPVRPTPVRAAALVALAATILTGFDVVCEPVSTVFGHQLWHHIAFINTDVSSYAKKPDWVFFNLNNKVLLLGIPIHNTAGWFFVGLICYCWLYYTFELHRVGLNKVMDRTVHSFAYFSAPPIVSLLCTSSFYFLYPPHPRGVRVAAYVYIAMLTALLRASYRNRTAPTANKIK